MSLVSAGIPGTMGAVRYPLWIIIDVYQPLFPRLVGCRVFIRTEIVVRINGMAVGRQLIGGTMLFASRQKQLPPVGCWRAGYLYRMTVWPCGRLTRIRYHPRRFDMYGPDLGLGTKKHRSLDAQKSHQYFRYGFQLCQK